MGTSILHQPQFLMPQTQEGHSKVPEIDPLLREQEFVSLIKKCKNMEEFKQVHGQILKLGLSSSSFCASNLVATCALSHWGCMDYACSIFRQIDYPNAFDFNTMIRGHVKDICPEEALFTYVQMLEEEVEPDNFTYPALLKACALLAALEEGKQIHGHVFKLGLVKDVFVQNSLISMYGKCGEIKDSCSVFEQMDELRSIASWSAVIASHAHFGLWGECLRFFSEMNCQGRWRAEESIAVSALSACANLGALNSGRSIHGCIVRNLSGLNVIVETSLIDMYMKCGCPEKGMSIFKRMKNKNRMSYSAAISGLALHGRAQQALRVFGDILNEEIKPDDVIYVGVLSACGHAGLVEEGLKWFDKMRLEHGIEPTIHHYGCIVDLMGRAGMLREAFNLIQSMPMAPNEVLWRSLLSACKIHKNVEIGEIAANNLFQLNSQNASDYLMLAGIYAQAQRWHDVSNIRIQMLNRGSCQLPGLSSVEVKKKLHKFVSNDRSHPQSQEIYEMLHQMEWQLKFEGYSPDTSQVLLDVNEEEKRERLSAHSQKLAIAFALMNTSQGSPIRIARNVRMCSDCHTYTKLISMIYKRRIIVLDGNKFHHFIDGTCSCSDYW